MSLPGLHPFRPARGRVAALALLLVAGLLAVVAPIGGQPPASAAEGGRTWVVDAVDDAWGNRFESQDTGTSDVTITAGDTVEWRFGRAATDHDLTSRDTSSAWQRPLEEYRSPGGDPVRYTFTEPGTYDYICSVHGVVMFGSVVVLPAGSDNRPPTVNAGADPTTGPAPLAVHFMADATDPDGDPLTYHWDFGNGDSAEGPHAPYTFAAPGSFTAVLEVSDGRGGTTRKEFPITVTDASVPAVDAVATPSTGPAPLQVAFAATGDDPDGGPLDYAWDFGDGATGSGDRIGHTYLSDGTYEATVTATNAAGKVGHDTVTITVGGTATSLPSVEVSASPATGVAPLGVDFSTTVVTGGQFAPFADGSAAYPQLAGSTGLVRSRGRTEAWIDVRGLKPGGSHLVHVHENACSDNNGGAHFRFDETKPFAEANEIWMPFTAAQDGTSGRIEVSKAVRAGSRAVSVVIHDPDNPAKRIGCADLTPATAGLDYRWDFGDGTTALGPDPSHTYAAPGNYAATLTVSAAGHEHEHHASVTRSVDVLVMAAGDTRAPHTTIAGGPAGLVGSSSATFRLAGDEAGVTFSCRLDSAPWRACASPLRLTRLRDGAHRLQVRARDAAGNVDPTPAVRAWTVDTRRPTVRFTRAKDVVRDRRPTVRATVRDAHLLPKSRGVVVRIDGRKVSAKHVRLSGERLRWTPRHQLARGRHVVRITAVDRLGHRTTATWRFRLK